MTPEFQLLILSVVLLLIVCYGSIQNEHSVDALGTGTIRVPLSWCAINGSQVTDPGIPTDAVLSSRHENVTENVYLAQGIGITFRSGINAAVHGSFNFPINNDPDITMGAVGNATKEDPFRTEMKAIINNCNSAWQQLIKSGNVGIVNGIPTINIKRFVHNNGTIDNDLIGVSVCKKSIAGTACNEPWNGYVFVIDNCYTAIGSTCGWNNDAVDQNLAHELGHALGLNHRNNISALMNWEQIENGPSGQVSNIAINMIEKTALRNNAQLVPNAEIDPNNKISKGKIVQSIRVDDIEENNNTLPYEDLSAVKVTMDKEKNIIYFDQELFGLIPGKTIQNNQSNLQYVILIDLDNNINTGGNETTLQNIGVPSTKFLGIDLVTLAQLNDTDIIGHGWIISKDDKEITTLTPSSINFELNTMFLESHSRNIKNESKVNDVPIFNTIRTILNNSDNFIEMNRPFNIHSIIYANETIIDEFDNDVTKNATTTLELNQPYFPQCYTETRVDKGKNTTVEVAGLLPNSNLHLLIGNKLVAKGITDNSGKSNIELTIPPNITSGLHLLSVGVDNTALTANCEINILTSTTTSKISFHDDIYNN